MHKPVSLFPPGAFISKTRIERNSLIVIDRGSRQIASRAPDQSAIEVTDRRRGIRFDGATVISQRPSEVALSQSRRATAAPGRSQVRFGLHGMCGVGYGAIEL